MSLTLLLHCKSLTATREFYRDALGLKLSASLGNTVTATLNDSSLIFTESDLWNSSGPGADIENTEIVFKDGIGFDSDKLLRSVAGRYGQY